MIKNELIELMKHQFDFNENINIFCSKCSPEFDNKTKDILNNIRKEIKSLSEVDREKLIKDYKKAFLDSFYKSNQYIYFNDDEEKEIETIAKDLIRNLSYDSIEISEIESKHFDNIKKFIYKTNIHIYNLNKNDDKYVKSFVCSEYSAEFIIDLFNLDMSTLKEPILDIGCGSHGNLVRFLKEEGLETYGFDRLSKFNFVIEKDWFDFEYGINKWGTIISNLSFCSHYLHNYSNNYDLLSQYEETYEKILNSLNKGGIWIYAPSLPFIEDKLDKNKYIVERNIVVDGVYRTKITKLF